MNAVIVLSVWVSEWLNDLFTESGTFLFSNTVLSLVIVTWTKPMHFERRLLLNLRFGYMSLHLSRKVVLTSRRQKFCCIALAKILSGSMKNILLKPLWLNSVVILQQLFPHNSFIFSFLIIKLEIELLSLFLTLSYSVGTKYRSRLWHCLIHLSHQRCIVDDFSDNLVSLRLNPSRVSMYQNTLYSLFFHFILS